jgi:Cu(I)/Ag(I) efflux system protein CusF
MANPCLPARSFSTSPAPREDNMTMVFRVKDPAMLKQVKVGDKVQFAAGLVNGEIAVTSLQKSK